MTEPSRAAATFEKLAVMTSVLVLAGIACARPIRNTQHETVTAYEGGRWFDGSDFQTDVVYVQGQRFVAGPSRVDRVVDLKGAFVVAPFGEAHNHNVEPSPKVAEVLHRYLRAGVYYVANPNNLPGARSALAGQINQPGKLEVIFANGGLTGPGGHPAEIARRNVARGLWSSEEGEGRFFFSISDRSEIAQAWPRLLATRPDFIKVYLLYSEQYAARLTDPTKFGWRGLAPELLPEVVHRAHAAGLRVAAHVESGFDFHVAVTAGVDQVAHMPGFRGDEATALPSPSQFQISDDDAQLARQKGIVVVTTLAGLAKYADVRGDKVLRRNADQLNRVNLEVLQRNRVALAIGSDEYGDTSVEEATYLVREGLLRPADVLRSWSEITPQAILPGRKVGRLAPGFEASFLVLEGNPLSDFTQATRIRFGMKQGIEVPAGPRSFDVVTP